MKISRNTSGKMARRSLGGRGCAPLFVLIMVAAAVVILGRNWIGQRLQLTRSQHSPVNLAAAQAAFNGGDLETAAEYAQRVLEREPGDAAAYELLIRALIYRSYADFEQEADRERALKVSRDGIVALPRDLSIQAAHGYALLANGSADEAGRLALRVIERAGQHVLARIVLSLSYGAQGIFDAALREAELSVELAERAGAYQLESRRALAIAHGDRGDYQRALTELGHAIGINSKLIPLHFEAALYALQISDFDQATVSYYRIMALDEGNVKVRARLCELSNRLQERDSALRFCGEVTELAPLWSDGWYRLGREHFLGGNYEQAQAAFNWCTRLQADQNIAIAERQLECWFLQGQSAELSGDCNGLLAVHREFLEMAQRADLPQTWSYPPDGPPICAAATLTALAPTPST